jgi:hypothetical protein
MCPMCVGSAVVYFAGGTSAGGLALWAARVFNGSEQSSLRYLLRVGRGCLRKKYSNASSYTDLESMRVNPDASINRRCLDLSNGSFEMRRVRKGCPHVWHHI